MQTATHDTGRAKEKPGTLDKVISKSVSLVAYTSLVVDLHL